MYTYEIKENGYVILKNGRAYIVQEEPFIPNPSLTYEENAKAQILGLEAPVKEEEDLKTRMANMEIAIANMMGV